MQDITDFKHFLRTDPNASAFLSESRADAPLTLARAPGRLDVMGGVGRLLRLAGCRNEHRRGGFSGAGPAHRPHSARLEPEHLKLKG